LSEAAHQRPGAPPAPLLLNSAITRPFGPRAGHGGNRDADLGAARPRDRGWEDAAVRPWGRSHRDVDV